VTTTRQKFRFKFYWRDYQQHFLNHFHQHITDNHLHVVAPPGSGKTILGLEMLLRINKSSLVLAPTLTIRNQWKSRFINFFEEAETFENTSLDIKHPSYLTFSTYQSLLSLYKSFGDKSDQSLLEFIVKNKIETLVLDEAHHLRNGWWNALFALKEVPNLTIIALTATPPYDSSAHEIERYFRLCGPIDDEIAVPDLIKNKDLCPHQDYVYFSRPNKADIKYIIRYREQIMGFTSKLLHNLEFIAFLKHLDIYKDAENQLEVIYGNPMFFSSILIFLKEAGEEISKEKLTLLGFKKNETNFLVLVTNGQRYYCKSF
jgi:superfamily II DNA or RNA helicase